MIVQFRGNDERKLLAGRMIFAKSKNDETFIFLKCYKIYIKMILGMAERRLADKHDILEPRWTLL